MSLLESDLANGRQWTSVGACYEVTKKPRSLDRSSVSVIPFAAMEAIPQDGTYTPSLTLKAPDAIASGTYFERGDILVAKITPSFENGKQALALDLPAPFGYATTEVIPLHPREPQHDPRLLFFYLLHPDIRHHVAERMEGTTGRQRVPEDVLLDLPIPSLHREEQTVMADALETIQRAAAVETQCELAAQNLKRAAMRELFTLGLRSEAQRETEIGPVPESWDIVRVEDNASVVSKGASPKWQGFNYVEQGILFVRSQNVGNGFMLWDDHAFLPPEWNEKEKRSVLRAGDVLINLVGASIGRCAVGGPEVEGGNCNQAVCFVRLNQNEVIPKFLSAFLLTAAGQTQIHGNKKDIARANLSLQDVRQLLMPKPNIDEQREIVAVLDSIDREIELHRKKRAVLDELFKTLLQKLITGEIRVADLDLSALATARVAEAAQRAS
jgi:type I restriction enzyme S subunit